MDPKVLIQSAENQYRPILERFFASVYNENKLPSHGLDHHRRVWGFAKELLCNSGVTATSKDHKLITSVLIASFLHDAGMSDDPGPRHGWRGEILCRQFLESNNLDENNFPGLLPAIREHDNKKYETGTNNLILKILSLADDLDAFGFTGIYRYIEIYYLRGIVPDEMGSRIRENATGRYRHFSEFFNDNPQLVSKHRKRFEILDCFFKSFDKQPGACGYRKVAEILIEMIMEKGILNEIAVNKRTDKDPVVKWFFENLCAELGFE